MFSTPPDLRRSSPDLRQSSIDLRTDVLYRKNLMEFFFIPEKEIILIYCQVRDLPKKTIQVNLTEKTFIPETEIIFDILIKNFPQ